MPFVLNSQAFPDGGPIPPKYTADGENVSPPLEWNDPPPGTRSYALIVDDPDAPRGVFKHWAIYNIDGNRDRLPEGVTAGAKVESLGRGVNDFGHPRYDGPDPPKGHGTHHYHFHLMALDVERLDLPPKAKVDEVRAAAKPHVLGEAELVGTYSH
ncbi:MAG TPA: YbhB/YbcL family Raf kinase inhibitor-like protein [Azospirillum sp.]|nr:YbhB/YbcL family Raf kinase inhibitor-like protein [Azospirillum sp.]